MKLEALAKTDVLVMGAGLAGISAAIAAAEAGAKVCLVSSSKIFSGSSFYPGTWGLGLIAPENDDDIKNLSDTICRLGESMAVPSLVEVFTANIQRYIDKLESMGCKFKRPTDSGQREYIPCFDYKNRNWYGIMQQQSVEVLAKRMGELGILELPNTEIVDFLQHDGQLCGVAVLCADNQLRSISCGALVVAGGGMGGIFRYRLNTSDISGVGQLLAMRSGASLINAEFFQMFLGYKAPAPKTIYNEKMFRYTNFFSAGTEQSIFEGIAPQRLEQLLEERSSHGPFTSRLADREIDRIISEQTAGVDISYNDTIKQMKPRPEFIETYFHWLEEKKGLTIDDKVELGIFAHASNGGIAIDTVGFTGVPGLFACGEATGGMHGADRIGGLSTANCLVFGNRAGEAAAVFSKEAHGKLCCADYSPPWIFQDAAELLGELQDINSNTLMVVRCQSKLEAASARLREMRAQTAHSRCRYSPDIHTPTQLRDSLHIAAAIHLTDCIQQAALLRRESRGSHYRTDFPTTDDNLAHCIRCSGSESVTVEFMG